MATADLITVPLRPQRAELPEDIDFAWDISDAGVTLEYIGTAERLISCGAVEPQMTERLAKRSPAQRRDSAGHAFRRDARVNSILKITRKIADPLFAESLPGVPRGLRFKRLDWLDAHPGEVHVTSYAADGPLRGTNRFTCTSGTREALIAAGFSPRLLKHKMRPFESYFDYKDLVSKDANVHVDALMRGYIRVSVDERVNLKVKPPSVEVKASRPSHLRLVVDNEARP